MVLVSGGFNQIQALPEIDSKLPAREETESSRSREAPGRGIGAGRDVAFSEGTVPVRHRDER